MDKLFEVGKTIFGFGKSTSSDRDESDDDDAAEGRNAPGGRSNNPLANIPLLSEVFNMFDLNKDGLVNSGDIMIMLEKLGLGFIPESIVTSVMEQVDTNGNGSFDLTDFITLVGMVKAASNLFG
ncbi:hypothetical protein GJ496_003724 [Pomphorhynchus laevis]|nr:hypothetical protein GJ496_003724 [Pomphorhynchus laevis]